MQLAWSGYKFSLTRLLLFLRHLSHTTQYILLQNIILDGGKFAYIHHATNPPLAGPRLGECIQWALMIILMFADDLSSVRSLQPLFLAPVASSSLDLLAMPDKHLGTAIALLRGSTT